MDGVMHPSVEQAIGRDRIRNALKRYENNPADEHDRGIVRAVNSDGSYEVLLDGDVQTARCAPYAKAMVGDRVIVVTTKDGENVLLGRLGGETIAPTIEERFEALEVDYIVAEGTSGFWTWEKWASGKAKCWGLYTGTETYYAGPYAGWFYGYYGTVSLPFTFVGDPIGQYSVSVGAGFSVPAMSIYKTSTPTTVAWYALANDYPTCDVKVDLMIEGRWK